MGGGLAPRDAHAARGVVPIRILKLLWQAKPIRDDVKKMQPFAAKERTDT